MNLYKELWIKTYDELYNNFLSNGLGSDESDRRALLLVDEKALEILLDKAEKINKLAKEKNFCPK